MFYSGMAAEKGRGATLNGESRRFKLAEQIADGDWLDALELIDGPPSPPPHPSDGGTTAHDHQ